MFKNYFRAALRNILKSKAFSLINIVGLSIGIAVAFLIGLWAVDELSYDHYHLDHSRIAQVMTTATYNNETQTYKDIAIPVAGELRYKYGSSFSQIVLASFSATHILSLDEKKLTSAGMWVQPQFPAMFTLKMQQGDLNALADPVRYCWLSRLLMPSSEMSTRSIRRCGWIMHLQCG